MIRAVPYVDRLPRCCVVSLQDYAPEHPAEGEITYCKFSECLQPLVFHDGRWAPDEDERTTSDA